MRPLGRILVATVLLVLCADFVQAQTNRLSRLTVSGFPLLDSETAIADLETGSISMGSTSFTVDLVSSAGGQYTNRYTNVEILCAAPCPVDVTRLQWRRADSGTWNALSATTWASVEIRLATFNGTNDPWSQTIFWRYMVDWENTPPAPALEYRIQYRLTATQNPP